MEPHDKEEREGLISYRLDRIDDRLEKWDEFIRLLAKEQVSRKEFEEWVIEVKGLRRLLTGATITTAIAAIVFALGVLQYVVTNQ
jgi:hypothetical protein